MTSLRKNKIKLSATQLATGLVPPSRRMGAHRKLDHKRRRRRHCSRPTESLVGQYCLPLVRCRAVFRFDWSIGAIMSRMLSHIIIVIFYCTTVVVGLGLGLAFRVCSFTASLYYTAFTLSYGDCLDWCELACRVSLSICPIMRGRSFVGVGRVHHALSCHTPELYRPTADDLVLELRTVFNVIVKIAFC